MTSSYTKEAASAWLEAPLNSPEQALCRTPFALSPALCSSVSSLELVIWPYLMEESWTCVIKHVELKKLSG